jgi:transposase-like protein
LIKEKNEVVGRSHNKYLQMGRDFIEVCPNCKSYQIDIRRRKTPKYKCKICGNVFDDPKTKIAYKTQKQKDDFGRQYSNPDE